MMKATGKKLLALVWQNIDFENKFVSLKLIVITSKSNIDKFVLNIDLPEWLELVTSVDAEEA